MEDACGGGTSLHYIRTAASNAESHGKGNDNGMESGIRQGSPTVMMITIGTGGHGKK